MIGHVVYGEGLLCAEEEMKVFKKKNSADIDLKKRYKRWKEKNHYDVRWENAHCFSIKSESGETSYIFLVSCKAIGFGSKTANRRLKKGKVI